MAVLHKGRTGLAGFIPPSCAVHIGTETVWQNAAEVLNGKAAKFLSIDLPLTSSEVCPVHVVLEYLSHFAQMCCVCSDFVDNARTLSVISLWVYL